jgi:hypothetical protein
MVSKPVKKICPVCGVVMDPDSMEKHLNKNRLKKMQYIYNN